jgi:hypothetical protein
VLTEDTGFKIIMTNCHKIPENDVPRMCGEQLKLFTESAVIRVSIICNESLLVQQAVQICMGGTFSSPT